MANTIEKLSNSTFRVLLDALAGAASVTIGFSDKTVAPDLEMVAPDWQPNQFDSSVKSLQDLVKVSVPVPTSDVSAAVPITVVKAGTTHADFEITVTNGNASEGQISGTMELYINWVPAL